MNVQALVTRSRRLGYVDSSQYTDDNAVEDFNVIYHDLEDDIVTKVREDYFWDYFVSDTVVDNVEYSLPDSIGSGWTGLEKGDGVSIKYTTDGDFVKARRVNQNGLEFDDSWYKENQPETDPFYYIKDNSIFLFPATSDEVVGGVKMEGIKGLVDLVLASIETELFNNKIPTKFHSVIAMGMLEYVYTSRGMPNEATNARNVYLLKKADIIKQLQNRDYMFTEIEDPNLSNLS